MIGLGLLLLIVPGLIAAAWTFGMQQAVMIEGRKAGDAFERSRDLARGNLMHVLLTAVMTLVITFVGVIGAMVVLGYVFTGTRSLNIVSTLVMILLNPLAAVVNTVLYYDLRIRKEGYDVEVYAERMDAGVPVAG
jgi:ABC-type spermidine/putrescine transport system permease subunit II